jgi:hypothetical protein
MFFIGAVITKIAGAENYSMFVAVVFLTKAVLCAVILAEPPINPRTAVKRGDDG